MNPSISPESFSRDGFGIEGVTCAPDKHSIASHNGHKPEDGELGADKRGDSVPPISKADAFRELLPRLLPLLRPYRSLQIEIIGCLILAAVCNVATPVIVKYFLRDLQVFFRSVSLTTADAELFFHSYVLRFVGALVCLYMLGALVSLRRMDAVSRLNQNVLNALQVKLFTHLLHLPHSFHARAKIGDLMTCLTGDMDNIQTALNQLTNKSLYQIFMLVGGSIGLLLTTGFSVLTLLILLIVPLFVLAYSGLRERNKAASKEQRRVVGQTAAIAQENLAAHHVIKAFGLQERVVAAFAARIREQRRSRLRLVRLNALTDVSEDVATGLAQLVILGVGGYLVLLHHELHIHIEDLVASLLLVKYIIGPAASLSSIGQTVQQASGSMDRITQLFDEPVTVADRPEAYSLTSLEREITLENVTFAYDAGGSNVIKDISLTIPALSHVAIVGPTGCGKSTTINLLMRFWDPVGGRILFDGHDLRDVKLTSHRAQIGLVFQDAFVFDTTVRDNISIGRPDASAAEVEAATRAALLHEEIAAMPNGYDTVLGERGVRMSGGQRQRLAIARAILCSPSVLLLDEATSALDAQTEAGILQTIATLKLSRTIVSVTHRLSWAKEADFICVLENGCLVEQGTHHELVGAGGLYQTLYQDQVGTTAAPEAPAEQLS